MKGPGFSGFKSQPIMPPFPMCQQQENPTDKLEVSITEDFGSGHLRLLPLLTSPNLAAMAYGGETDRPQSTRTNARLLL